MYCHIEHTFSYNNFYAVLVDTLMAKTKSWEEERNKVFLYDEVKYIICDFTWVPVSTHEIISLYHICNFSRIISQMQTHAHSHQLRERFKANTQ